MSERTKRLWGPGAAMLAAVCLTGCGTATQMTMANAALDTAAIRKNDSVAQSAAETAETAASGIVDSSWLSTLDSDEYLAVEILCNSLYRQLYATGENAEAGSPQAQLAEFCKEQPGSISVWMKDITTGDVYSYGEDTLYYGASTLKTPYALWLCTLAENGKLDLAGEITNTHLGRLEDSTLVEYNDSATVPVAEAITAMIAYSDNDATDLLMNAYPGTVDTGFIEYLKSLGYADPETCTMTTAAGVEGYTTVEDAGVTMQALWSYLRTDTAGSALLQQAFTQAEHNILYVPTRVAAAKKYGSWDAAFHDEMIVYDTRPYILCCFTDWGNTEIDFPADAVARMQLLGKMANYWVEY